MKNLLLTIVVSLIVSVSQLTAVEVSLEEKISSLYISFFNRAADKDGLEHWNTAGANVVAAGGDALSTLKELSEGFAGHPTFTATYGAMNNEEFVQAIYQNSLGRAGDAQGVAYWKDLLDKGKSRSDMVAEFMDLSLTLDLTPENFPELSTEELAAAQERQDLISNKVNVAVYFTKNLQEKTNVADSQNPTSDPAYLASIKVLSEVDLDPLNVDVANGRMFLLMNNPEVINIINTLWSTLDYRREFNGNFEDVPLEVSSVGVNGGNIEINDPSSPINGLKITIPDAATTEDINFTVSYADVDNPKGMPDGTFVASKMIKISANGSDEWNTHRTFEKLIEVTLPYDDESSLVVEESLRYYYYNPVDGTLQAEGFTKMDTVNNTITFLTRSFGQSELEDETITPNASTTTGNPSAFGTYVLAGFTLEKLTQMQNSNTVIDTGFRAKTDGWYIPNYGSYYDESQGGNCMGMVAFAKYYHKKNYTPKLRSNYRDEEPTETWLDDDTAIELASRVHSTMSKAWSQLVNEEYEQNASSYSVALSLVGSLYMTNNLTKIGIYEKVVNNTTGSVSKVGGHEISTYKVELKNGEMIFHVYDPNFSNDDTRRITYTSNGFKNYAGGTDASSSKYNYNMFYHSGYRMGLTDSFMKTMKEAADKGFKDNTKFPTITITSIVGAKSGEVIYDKENPENIAEGTEGLTNDGQHKYITKDTAVKITGTILGGLAQEQCCVVNNLRVLLKTHKYSTPVNNQVGGGDGKFEITIPLLAGENMVAFLGAKNGSYSKWSAFDQQIIESTHSVSNLTVTLNWQTNNSDVDLYVKEPSLNGKTGDTVWYSNRAYTVSTSHPYLDFDNTDGYGPEHYIASEGMSTLFTDGTSNPDGLYGTYNIWVQYFSDNDDDYEEVQAVPWSVTARYLQYCKAPCTNPSIDGVWQERSASGVLSIDSDTPVGEFSIDYEIPDPDAWGTPESHTIMLP